MDSPVSFAKFVWSIFKSDVGQLGLAGIAGAIAASMVEWDGWVQLARKVTVGCLSAIYLSELTVPLFRFLLGGLDIPRDHSVELSAFLMGMLGIVIIEFLMHIFRSYRRHVKNPATPKQTSIEDQDRE